MVRHPGRITGGALTFALIGASLTAVAGAAPASAENLLPTPISEVVQSTSGNAKEQIIEVEGEPFFFNGTQIRADWIKNNTDYTEAEWQSVYQNAADDGFTVANSQLNWLDIQPDQIYPATKSTYVAGGTSANTNFSTAGSLKVGSSGSTGGPAISYFQFDFSDIEGTDADASKIRVYVNSMNAGTSDLHLYGIPDNSWDASTMTWNNGAPANDAGALNGTEGVDYIDLGGTPSYDPVNKVAVYDFDVTDFINDFGYTNGKTASFMLRSDAATAPSLTLHGASAANPPQLVISRADVWDYSWLDKIVGYAENADLKLELLWFGSQIVKLTADNVTPYYVIRNYEKAQTSAGNVLVGKGTGRDLQKDTVYRFFMSLEDPNLRELEYTALQNVFNRVGELSDANDGKRTVIGAQLVNEPGGSIGGDRSYSPYSQAAYTAGGYTSSSKFINESFLDYTQNLGAAVKESNYPVYTRINFHSAEFNFVFNNEKLRAQTGKTNVDFVGYDPYFDSTQKGFLYGQGLWDDRDFLPYNYAKNLPMVMENSGVLANADYLALATLAGGAVHNQYQYIGGANFGMYAYDFSAQNPNTAGVIATNNWLKTFGHDLATKAVDSNGGEQLAFFNPYGDPSSTSTKPLRSMPVQYTTTNRGVGVAIEQSADTFTLASKTASTFTLKGALVGGPLTVQKGAYDEQGTWTSSGTDTYTVQGDDAVISVGAYETLQVVTASPIPASTKQTVLDEDFNSQLWGAAPSGWTRSTTGGNVDVYPKPGETDLSLRINRTATTAGVSFAEKSFTPASGKVRVSTRVLKDSTTARFAAPSVYASDGTLLAAVAFDASGKIAHQTSGGTWTVAQNYITRKWYGVVIDIDTATDTYSLTIDGVKKATNVPLLAPVSDVAKIRYSTENTRGATYFDDITVSSR